MFENAHVLDPDFQTVFDARVAEERDRLFRAQDLRNRVLRARGQVAAGGKVSIARAVLAMSNGNLYKGAPFEHDVLERVDGDPQRVRFPFSAFRDLTAAAAGAGGYLVGTETPAAVDALRPWSVTARAGILIAAGLQGNQAVPKVTEHAIPQWLQTEATPGTPSTPALSQIVLTPKTVTAIVSFSRQLALQANAEFFVKRELMRVVGTAIDQAVLNGSGASGQPLGLLQAPGIGSQSGASLAYAGVVAMKADCALANAPDESISYIGTPGVRQLLETRERATGNGFVWDDDRVASRPARVTNDLPAATLVAGAWEALFLGVWGDGFVLEVNPYDPVGFTRGMVEGRIIVSCDVAALHAAAFSVATSIT